ncbi:major facilitator superfamily domain-containing protein [Penicillium brevicompactum]
MHHGHGDSTSDLEQHRLSVKSDAPVAPPPDIETQHITVQGSHETGYTSDDSLENEKYSLPPVDGGKDAWLCLLGAFILEMVVWGFAFSFGVLQDYYSTNAPFSHDHSSRSIVGSCCMGILYLASPISLFVLQKWPRITRINSVLGLAIAVTGVLTSSFATKMWQLTITQGVIYPIGGAMLYYPVLLFVDEWFERRKGLAFGVAWAGSGVAGVVFPLLLRWALSRFSFKITMWAWSIGMVVLVCPILAFVKPRIPVNTDTPKAQSLSFSFLRTRSWIVFQIGSLIQSIGYFAPSLYMPTYARVIAHQSAMGETTPVTALNAGSVLGFIMVGYLVDRWHAATVVLAMTVSTVILVFALWGLSVTLAPICVFSALYGVVAGSAAATWPGMAKIIKKEDPSAPVGMVLGTLTAGRGIGSIACGPISEALIKTDWAWTGHTASLGYGTKFGGLIVFTGVTACFGIIGFAARKLRLIQ